jgi:elongation factor Ts
MTKITAAMVKELREDTGAGVLDAKKALEKANGNYDEAVKILREKGAARAAKRADRQASEGIVEVYGHPGGRVGVMVELNCESFQELAHDLALQVAAAQPQYISMDEVPQDILDGETDVLRAQARTEGKPEEMIDKIVAGRLNKFYEEICLLEQPFIKDDKRKIKDLLAEAVGAMGENIVIRRFVRYELGGAS